MSLESLRSRLVAARAEQARLGEQYRRSLGTPVEQSSYALLRAVTARVARYERLMSSFEPRRPDLPAPG